MEADDEGIASPAVAQTELENDTTACTEKVQIALPAVTQTELVNAIETIVDDTNACMEKIQIIPPAVTQTEWVNATVATLDDTKARGEKVQAALKALEQQEAERLAAARAKKKLQELEAEVAEKKRKEAVAAEKETRAREIQAEELRKQQESLRLKKHMERAELAAATANFKKMQQEENDAREKDRVMDAAKTTSQQLLDGVLECQHTCGKLWGALLLCEKRQRLREGRPQAEKFKDNVDMALEREFQKLSAAREELIGLVTRGQAFRDDLEKLRIELNTEQSRENCILRLKKSSSTPALASSHQPPKEVLKKATAAIDEAIELPKQMASSRLKVDTECEIAVSDVHSSLDQRKAELGRLIKGLQDQSKASERTISDAEKRITKLKRHAQSTMESPRSSQATDDQLALAESMLTDLKSLKDTLESDLSNKYHALKIDESCRQLTKIRSGDHVSKLGQSMRKTKSEGTFIVKSKVSKGKSQSCMMQPAG